MTEILHAGLARYLRRMGMEAGDAREDGAVVLVVDGLHRVYCRPAPGGALALEARLAMLPQEQARADAMLATVMAAAAPRLAQHAQTLALGPDGGALYLQQWIDSEDAGPGFESGLEDFINAIAYFQALAGQG